MSKLNLTFNQNQVIRSAFDPGGKQGNLANYDRWVSTDYIPLDDAYAISYTLAGHLYLESVAYFDADKKYISGVGTRSSSGCATIRGISLVPDNAKFVRFINFTGGGYPASFNDSEVFTIADKENYDLYMLAHPNINLKIACLGDSLTEGDYGLVVGAACVHYKNYPWFLERELDCQTVNFGRCGYTVKSYSSFFSSGSVYVSDADIVLIMLGTNAGIHNIADNASFDLLIKNIRSKMKSDAKLVLITPPHATLNPSKPNYGYGDNVASAVDYICSYAKKNNALLIDAFRDSPVQTDTESIYQPNDGLHMAEKGYEAFAHFIAEKLIEMNLIK